MNQNPQEQRPSFWSRLKDVPREVVLGLITGCVSGALVWAFVHVKDRVTSEPVTASISAGDGQTSIRPFFDLQIRPALGAYCSEAAWVQWIGNLVWNKQCRRINFEPHSLADLETRRIPFSESAEPIELMEIFIDRHSRCLMISLDGDTYRISEPSDSDIIRDGMVAVCP